MKATVPLFIHVAGLVREYDLTGYAESGNEANGSHYKLSHSPWPHTVLERGGVGTVLHTYQYFVLLFLQELEVTAKILLAKGGETSGFIRDDVEKALTAMVCSLTPTRVLVSLILGGARSVPIEIHQTHHLKTVTQQHTLFTCYFLLFTFSHRNVAVRKTTAQFLSLLAERMGANRLMSGAKDVTEKILPTAAQFVTDGGPETRCTCVENPLLG